MQILEGPVIEPCADMSDISPSVIFAHGENKRTKKRARPFGAVKPAMTTSWRFAVLILSQSAVRVPDT